MAPSFGGAHQATKRSLSEHYLVNSNVSCLIVPFAGFAMLAW